MAEAGFRPRIAVAIWRALLIFRHRHDGQSAVSDVALNSTARLRASPVTVRKPCWAKEYRFTELKSIRPTSIP